MNKQATPIFIVGTPRSGTTLLRLIIDSHPQIAITPESSFLFRKLSFWSKLYPDLSDNKSIQNLIDDLRKLPQVRDWLPATCTVEELTKFFPIESMYDFFNAIFSYYAFSKGKSRWGDKTPKNLHGIDAILELFPNAKILIMVRDCRDVAMSLNKAEFSQVSYLSAAKRWQSDADIIKKILIEKDNKQVYLLKYEDLLENPDKSIQSILRFCELPEDSNILQRYLEHGDDVFHVKSSLYMQPVSKDNLLKWKGEMSDSGILECEAIARKGLEYFGYEIVNENPKVFIARTIFIRMKDLINLLMNKKNMENYYIYGHLMLKMIKKLYLS